MEGSKYGHLIVTRYRTDVRLPGFRSDRPAEEASLIPPRTHLVWLDGEVVPGAKMYSECVWFWPMPAEELEAARRENRLGELQAHTHPFDEVIAFLGTNPEDPYDLGGEIELWLEDECHRLTTSFLAWVPAGMKHCPLIFRRIDRPMFHFTLGPGREYR
ncbi:MAG: hypothetical protein NUV99_12070 [Clostridia bacterium]|jgi:hypothetical protein|nr:hypothetical protein [Clostridia bacterium]